MRRRFLLIAWLLGVMAGPAGAQEIAGKKTAQAAAFFGIALALEGDEAFIGEPLTMLATGVVYVYAPDEATGVWAERQRLMAGDAVPGDGFGWAAAVEDDVLVAGAPSRDNDIGAAYVFRKDVASGAWAQEAKLTASDRAPRDRFGQAVALSGDVAVVGAPGDAEQGAAFRGAAYVFRRDAATGAWTQEAKLTAHDGQAPDWFGRAVAVAGDVAVVGAPFHNDDHGAAYVFLYDATTGSWAQHQKLTETPTDVPNSLGWSVAIQGDHIMVGSPGYNAGGAVFMYRRAQAGLWTRRQQMTGTLNDNLGWSVQIDGEYMVIGALGDDDFAGAAHVMVRQPGSGAWIIQQKLSGSQTQENDFFGSSVAVSGNRALVWSQREGLGEGVVYLFERSETTAWAERARLVSEGGSPEAVVGASAACVDGVAATFPCSNANLLAYLPAKNIGGMGSLNDIWGWTDPQTGAEYALVGRNDGTAFVDVSDPVNPVFLGVLPTHSVSSGWRDIKVYADHAFIVSEAPVHGMQIFDLTQLRAVQNPPVTFDETTHYLNVNSAHNIAINEETGFAYIVGAGGGRQTCGGGLHMVDIRDPINPAFAGCFADPTTGRGGGGYTHDVQCVVYRGPDADYQGREICIGSNETAISIADVTNKANPVAISTATYPNVGYTHQGWLTDDHRYFFLDDEGDEFTFGLNTRTLIWDFEDLDDPLLLAEYFAETTTTDHNQYVVGNRLYQANYSAGLRILNISDVANPVEVAFFDTSPGDIGSGAWSVYPFFDSGVIVVSGISEGLFIIAPPGITVATETEEVPEAFVLSPAFPNPFNPATTLTLTLPTAQPVTVAAYDVLGREVAVLHRGPLAAGTHRLVFEASNLPSGIYLIRADSATVSQAQMVTLVR